MLSPVRPREAGDTRWREEQCTALGRSFVRRGAAKELSRRFGMACRPWVLQPVSDTCLEQGPSIGGGLSRSFSQRLEWALLDALVVSTPPATFSAVSRQQERAAEANGAPSNLGGDTKHAKPQPSSVCHAHRVPSNAFFLAQAAGGALDDVPAEVAGVCSLPKDSSLLSPSVASSVKQLFQSDAGQVSRDTGLLGESSNPLTPGSASDATSLAGAPLGPHSETEFIFKCLESQLQSELASVVASIQCTAPPRSRKKLRDTKQWRCQSEGCDADMSRATKVLYRRHRLCDCCAKKESLVVKGCEVRFCQQCSGLHPLLEFDGLKRSCRKTLEKHLLLVRRRRAARKEAAAAANERP